MSIQSGGWFSRDDHMMIPFPIPWWSHDDPDPVNELVSSARGDKRSLLLAPESKVVTKTRKVSSDDVWTFGERRRDQPQRHLHIKEKVNVIRCGQKKSGSSPLYSTCRIDSHCTMHMEADIIWILSKGALSNVEVLVRIGLWVSVLLVELWAGSEKAKKQKSKNLTSPQCWWAFGTPVLQQLVWNETAEMTLFKLLKPIND